MPISTSENLNHGLPLRKAARIATAADTVSIAVMEIVDNGFILLDPGAMRRSTAWAIMTTF